MRPLSVFLLVLAAWPGEGQPNQGGGSGDGSRKAPLQHCNMQAYLASTTNHTQACPSCTSTFHCSWCRPPQGWGLTGAL
jgi:hypothetical protein